MDKNIYYVVTKRVHFSKVIINRECEIRYKAGAVQVPNGAGNGCESLCAKIYYMKIIVKIKA